MEGVNYCEEGISHSRREAGVYKYFRKNLEGTGTRAARFRVV